MMDKENQWPFEFLPEIDVMKKDIWATQMLRISNFPVILRSEYISVCVCVGGGVLFNQILN